MKKLLLILLIVGSIYGQNWGTSIGIGLTDNMNVLESGFQFNLDNNISIFSTFGLPTQMLGINYQQNNQCYKDRFLEGMAYDSKVSIQIYNLQGQVV